MALLIACNTPEKPPADNIPGAPNAAAADSVKNAGTGPALEGVAVAPPSDVGDSEPLPCILNSNSSLCRGFRLEGFDNRNTAYTHADWVAKELNRSGQLHAWRRPSAPTLRTPAQGSDPQPTFTIRIVKSSEKIRLRDMGGVSPKELLIARIDVAPGSKIDTRYGIGDMPGMDTSFYLAVRNFTYKSGDTPDPVRQSYKVAEWKIFGIKKGTAGQRDALVRVGNTGVLRWCEMTHQRNDRKGGARFMTCPNAALVSDIATDSMLANALAARTESTGQALLSAIDFEAKGPKTQTAIQAALNRILYPGNAAEILTRGPLIQEWSQRLAKIYADEPGSPAWLTCGIGCCTADDK